MTTGSKTVVDIESVNEGCHPVLHTVRLYDEPQDDKELALVLYKNRFLESDDRFVVHVVPMTRQEVIDMVSLLQQVLEDWK